ncbi:MAG: 8-oxo-dGTP diphosphatase MutT, partial [Rhodothermales bacterium]
ALAGRLMDDKRPGAFNQALMELGATVCTPRAPSCPSCPLRAVCAAEAHGDQEQYPVTPGTKKIPHYDVAVALVYDGDRLLIQRRPEDGMLGGLWEFPGGKLERDETAEEACVRELEEELGVRIDIIDLFHSLSHAYSHFKITLHAFRARILDGTPHSATGMPVRWVQAAELDGFAFPRANRKLIERLANENVEPPY